MPDIVHWSTFFTATIILLLIPGPSVMYVVTRGIEHGYRGVVLSSVGLALGDLLQVLCTVAGLAALLACSVLLFGTIAVQEYDKCIDSFVPQSPSFVTKKAS